MRSLFKEPFIDKGEITVGDKIEVVFEGKAPLPEELKLQSSCGCSKPHFDKDNNRIVVVYKAKSIPIHLKDKGYYTSMKSISVVDRESNHKEVLTFKTIVNEYKS